VSTVGFVRRPGLRRFWNSADLERDPRIDGNDRGRTLRALTTSRAIMGITTRQSLRRGRARW